MKLTGKIEERWRLYPYWCGVAKYLEPTERQTILKFSGLNGTNCPLRPTSHRNFWCDHLWRGRGITSIWRRGNSRHWEWKMVIACWANPANHYQVQSFILKPDQPSLQVTKISAGTLKHFFNQMQYLHPGSTLIFENERDDETITYHIQDRRLVDYLKISRHERW